MSPKRITFSISHSLPYLVVSLGKLIHNNCHFGTEICLKVMVSPEV